MQNGKVKFYNESKGFGFIVDDSNNQEIFVHASGLKSKEIRENDAVKFNLKQGKKGINAVDVELV